MHVLCITSVLVHRIKRILNKGLLRVPTIRLALRYFFSTWHTKTQLREIKSSVTHSKGLLVRKWQVLVLAMKCNKMIMNCFEDKLAAIMNTPVLAALCFFYFRVMSGQINRQFIVRCVSFHQCISLYWENKMTISFVTFLWVSSLWISNVRNEKHNYICAYIKAPFKNKWID